MVALVINPLLMVLPCIKSRGVSGAFLQKIWHNYDDLGRLVREHQGAVMPFRVVGSVGIRSRVTTSRTWGKVRL